MSNKTHFSHKKLIFHGRQLPEEAYIVGYSAIIDALNLAIPIPKLVSLVSLQNKRYQTSEWRVFPNQYLPYTSPNRSELESLYKNLIFALKYEGINLLVFKFLTQHYTKKQLATLVSIEPTGQYSRRIWFIIEWLIQDELPQIPKLKGRNYITVVDTNIQFGIDGVKSPRHLVINNLPGTPEFCPMIYKTAKLNEYLSANYSGLKDELIKHLHKDILHRASSFLLLKDSKASFTIEGESPKSRRATRWGYAIGQAGTRPLTPNELIRLQQVVIEDTRFIQIGYRQKGGFVGEHDRITGAPIPDHISAHWQDIDTLLNGLTNTCQLLINSNMDAVLTASAIAFGFVFIHPFQDGNGRIHRYIIHHILARKGFAQQGIIFPVSASILNHINDYRAVLEAYSHPLLDFIEWQETNDHNIEVLNNTIDYYRFFDATPQTEFLYECVEDTIKNIIPHEVTWLTKYDSFKKYIDEAFEMPDSLIALLVKFLEQNNGTLSKRAKEKEFAALTNNEVKEIEKQFREIMLK